MHKAFDIKLFSLKEKNGMKKTIIICASLLLAASIFLVGVIIMKNRDTKSDNKSKDTNITTYEQFTQYIRPGLSNEIMEEIQNIYNEYSNAKDEEKSAVLKRFYAMDIFEKKDKTSIDKASYDKGGK